jgi:hypothetical protein
VAGRQVTVSGITRVAEMRDARPVRLKPDATGVATIVGSGFTFTGFFRPVENLPTINVAQAGQNSAWEHVALFRFTR